MNSSSTPPPDPLKKHLQKDARDLVQLSNTDNKNRTIEMIRQEFAEHSSKAIPFPHLAPLLSIAAAIVLVAGLIFLQSQKQVDSTEFVVSPEVMQKSLDDLSELQNFPHPQDLTATLIPESILEEFNLMAEELESTFLGIWELVETS